MSGFKLQRLGILMEPEPGNPQEIEGVLNPAVARAPDGSFTFSRGWWREEITLASALHECGSMRLEIRQA
jgi:hypothetical protein